MNRVVNNQSDLQIEFLSERARCTVWSVELCKFRQLALSRISLPIGLIVDSSETWDDCCFSQNSLEGKEVVNYDRK